MNSLARVEVINTGTELLFGSVVNTHLSYLGQSLFPLGLRIQRQTTVPDGAVIRDAILEAAAALAEEEYRSNPELTAFDAFGEDDLYGDSSSTETR